MKDNIPTEKQLQQELASNPLEFVTKYTPEMNGKTKVGILAEKVLSSKAGENLEKMREQALRLGIHNHARI